MALFTRQCAVVIAIAVTMMMISCATDDAGSVQMTVSPDQYDAAFSAAVDAVRDAGLTPVVRDRRSGMIETDSRPAGSLLEPWRWADHAAEQTLANTLSFQRHRARVIFQPASGGLGEASDPIAAIGNPLRDLTKTADDLEMQVNVYVERAHRRGLKHNTWSQRVTTRYEDPQAGDADNVDGLVWRPVARDQAFEQRILTAIQQHLSTVPLTDDEPPASVE